MSRRTSLPFNGDRLREARCARGLTAAALAEMIDVTPSSVGHYENGRHGPSIDVLARISACINLPVAFFLAASEPRPVRVIRWRSRAASLKSARERACQRYEWLRRIVGELERFIEFPAPNMPSPIVAKSPDEISNDQVEGTATALRRYWSMGDGPISHMVRLVENQGTIVARAAFNDERLDAFSDCDGGSAGRCYIILGTDSGSAVRTRFNVGHEIGHVLLHQHIPEAIARTAEAHRAIELQAHRFARSFLLPASSFRAEIRRADLDELVALKSRWRVAIGAMIMRLFDLGFVDEAGKRELMIQRSRRGWRLKEPLDDEIPQEEPCLLERSIDALTSAGLITGNSLAAACHFHVGEIERLLGLPEGRLRPSGDRGPSLRLRDTPSPSGTFGGFTARLVD